MGLSWQVVIRLGSSINTRLPPTRESMFETDLVTISGAGDIDFGAAHSFVGSNGPQAMRRR
jgi:hypothetical protein